MSKAKAETASAAATAPETAAATPATPAVVAVVAVKTTTFRDKLYTSRTLILPDGEALAVTRGRVTVEDTDTKALEYIKAHDEFEPLE